MKDIDEKSIHIFNINPYQYSNGNVKVINIEYSIGFEEGDKFGTASIYFNKGNGLLPSWKYYNEDDDENKTILKAVLNKFIKQLDYVKPEKADTNLEKLYDSVIKTLEKVIRIINNNNPSDKDYDELREFADKVYQYHNNLGSNKMNLLIEEFKEEDSDLFNKLINNYMDNYLNYAYKIDREDYTVEDLSNYLKFANTVVFQLYTELSNLFELDCERKEDN